jgi:hypothetical protein
MPDFFGDVNFFARFFLHPEIFKPEIFGFEIFLSRIFFAIGARFPLDRTGFPPGER